MKFDLIHDSDLPAIAALFAEDEAKRRGSSAAGPELRAGFLRLFKASSALPHWARQIRSNGKVVGALWMNYLDYRRGDASLPFIHSLAVIPDSTAPDMAVDLMSEALRVALPSVRTVAECRLASDQDAVLEAALSQLPGTFSRARQELIVEKSLDAASADSALPEGYSIRLACPEDADFVTELNRQAFENGSLGNDIDIEAEASALMERLRDRGLILIAENASGRPVGHALLEPFFLNEFRCSIAPRIHDIFVVQAMHNRGLSRALGRACEDVAIAAGATMITGTVNAPEKRLELLIGDIAREGWNVTETRHQLWRKD